MMKFNQLGQWSLAKSGEEPKHYLLKDGSTLTRGQRGQTADGMPDAYNDDWALHDPKGQHLGYVNVDHSPSGAHVRGYSPFSFMGGDPDVPTLKMAPDGMQADEDSYNEHVALGNAHMHHAIPALAQHYGEVTVGKDNAPLAAKAAASGSNARHFTTHQNYADLRGWKPTYPGQKEHFAKMPAETWHHFHVGDSKVDYGALGKDSNVSTGGVYHGDDKGNIDFAGKPDKGTLN